MGVDDQKAAGFPVTTACEAAGVSTSGYYNWRARQAAGPTRATAGRGRTGRLDAPALRRRRWQPRVPRMFKALRHAGLIVTSSGWPA